MSINQLNFGHAVKIVVISPITGQVLTLTNVTSFDAQQQTKAVESAPLGAPPIFAEIPHGWSGKIMFDRVDSSIDDFFAQQEDAYWSNSLTYSGAIWEYILELNQTTTQWNYNGVTYKYTNAGKKVSQDKISLELDFRSSQRVKIT